MMVKNTNDRFQSNQFGIYGKNDVEIAKSKRYFFNSFDLLLFLAVAFMWSLSFSNIFPISVCV